MILYGATAGEAFLRGVVGERFAVRNSGATAVVEGVGDHGCEYMTGGRVVVLGPTGRNFGAGMSGGIAYVWDPDRALASLVNREMVDLEPLDELDRTWLVSTVFQHRTETGSEVAGRLLTDWQFSVEQFAKVMPRDYKRVLLAIKAAEESGARHRRGHHGRGQGLRRPAHGRHHRVPEARARSCPPAGRCRCACATGRRSTSRSPTSELQTQASRCMDCGIPFCNQGCPLGNLIPDWNDLVYRDRWREAIDRLHATNNFPEFTGRLCPAPCEAACVLGINQDPVTIKQVEVSIIEHAFAEGWVDAGAAVGPHGQEGGGRRLRPGRASPRPSS